MTGSDASASAHASAEFDRQVQTLVDLGYPALAGLTGDAFRTLLGPLRAPVTARAAGMPLPPAEGRAPFLLVVTRALAPLEGTVPLTTLAPKLPKTPKSSKTGSAGRTPAMSPGVIERFYAPGELERFVSLPELALPDGPVYVVFDVDRGEEFCGAVPTDALSTVAARGRSPLTIEEGVALITHYPQALAKNKCFSLGGSRLGDRRVPALWISKGAPKLGWCWEGNPHTWLGLASAGGRAR